MTEVEESLPPKTFQSPKVVAPSASSQATSLDCSSSIPVLAVQVFEANPTDSMIVSVQAIEDPTG